MRFGMHMTQKGGFVKNVQRAAALGCQTLQVFIGNPTSWSAPQLEPAEVDRRRQVLQECAIDPLVVHAAYLINLAAKKEEFHDKSCRLLRQTLHNAHLLGAAYVVLHVGSHVGSGFQEGMDLFIATLQELITDCPPGVELLLENTAGAGTSLGGSFIAVSRILQSLGQGAPLGVCLDTAHAWAFGYDLSGPVGLKDTMAEISRHFGKEKIKVVHFNDSSTPQGSRRDRHAHLGEGFIGEEGLKGFLHYPWPAEMPVILETPEAGSDWDATNLARLRSYAGEPLES